MKNTQRQTSGQTFSRVAEAGIGQLTEQLQRKALPKWWAAIFLLLLTAGQAEVRGQVVIKSDPNNISGKIKWVNSPGAVSNILNAVSPNVERGFSSYDMRGYDYPDSLFPVAVPVAPTKPSLFNYVFPVQGIEPGGAIYNPVTLFVYLKDNDRYFFTNKVSAPVLPKIPAGGGSPRPDVNLDFCECPGLLDIQFCDLAGNPLKVNGSVYANLVPSGARQADGPIALPTFPSNTKTNQKYLAVRGGEIYNVTATIVDSVGSDAFTDLITFGKDYTSNNVAVACDQIRLIKFCIDTNANRPNTNLLSKVIGRVDMLCEYEHWVNQASTLVCLYNGPYGNQRYDSVEPACFPSCLSPVIGTAINNSAGPFCLQNVPPSNFSSPAVDYAARAFMTYGLIPNYQAFFSPQLDYSNGRVNVPPSTTVNLADTFVFNPTFINGSVRLCGPAEPEGVSNSCLRFIVFGPDSDGNGVPDSIEIPYSRVEANGLNLLAPGATKTAYPGTARAWFGGSFYDSGADKDSFVGSYEQALGGLLQERTRWDANKFILNFSHTPTVQVPTYIYSGFTVANQHYLDQEMVPKEFRTNDHHYGLSKVTFHFTTTAGTFYNPYVAGSGSFNSPADGLNFEGQPANYTVSLYGYGTPTTSPGATQGTVVMCIPEGTYDFDSQITQLLNGGTSYNNLPRIHYKVGPCQCIDICPGLTLSVTNLPLCATQRVITVSGSVDSVTNVTHLFYELNGGQVTLCKPCGVSPAFSFPITLDDCVNKLLVTAIDSRGCTSTVQSVVKYDVTPPVISGCKDIYTNSMAGTNGNFVFYSVSAVDNCDGPVAVVCTPTNGSFFPIGKTVVTCVAVDSCKNTNICSFNIGIDTCLNIGNERFECVDYHVWTYTFTLTNCFPGAVSYVAFPEIYTPGVTMAGDPIIYLPTPIQPGESADISVTFSSPTNRPPPTNFCFLISIHNENFELCCSEVHWVAMPQCCLKIRNPKVTCVTNTPGCFNYMFTAQNLSEQIAKYLFIVPAPPPCFTVNPEIKMLTPLLYPGQSTNISIMFSNISPNCGTNLCFLISIHDTNLTECCGITNCIPNPAVPIIHCPSNIVAECRGPAGTPVTYSNATATGSCFSSNITIVCSPPSGFPFPKGTTMVKCHAWDNRGHTNWCTFTVTITDTVPPQIHCPPDIFAECESTNGTRVPFIVTASDICDSNVTILCKPPSNSLFPLGTTMVHCRAIDDCGNTNACWFNVTVRDTTPPFIVSASAICGSNKITLNFSEPLDPASPLTVPNFIVDDPVNQVSLAIQSIVFGATSQTVCIFTAGAIQAGISYIVTVNGVKDRCGNLIAANSQIHFQCSTNPAPAPLILSPSLTGGKVVFSMETEAGVTCHVEYTESLSPANWKLLHSIVGDGSTMTVTDSLTNAPQRFYRVRIP